MITGVGQISIVVHDLKKAVEFYRDVLGLHFLFEIPDAAFFNCGGVRLYLSLPSKAEFDRPSSIVYYKVDDIDEAYEALLARGVVFESKPHVVARLPDYELWLAFFRDLDGNMLALMSEIQLQRA
jgi:catechol 2,3-dioxygenase-like lactoylglutathione lyase family enzyme